MNKKIMASMLVLAYLLLPIFQVHSQPTLDPGKTVNPATGEMAFSLPLGTVKGVNGHNFPVSLSYKAGILYHQSASSVGLGFGTGAGGISRKVVFAPDDYQGHDLFSSGDNHCDEKLGIKIWKAVMVILTVVISIVVVIVSGGNPIAAGAINTVWTIVQFAGGLAFTLVIISLSDYIGGGPHLTKYTYEPGQGWGFFTEDDLSIHDIPDIYMVNTPFVSGELVWIGDKDNGHFVFKNSSGSQDKEKRTKKVLYNRDDHTFEIILENGTRLFFQNHSRTVNSAKTHTSIHDDKKDCWAWSKVDYKNSYIEMWHLSKVLFYDYIDGGGNTRDPMDSEDSNKGGWIQFKYRTIESTPGVVSLYKKSGRMQTDYQSMTLTESGKQNPSEMTEKIAQLFLEEIITPNQSAVFNYLDNRLDDWWNKYELKTHNLGTYIQHSRQHMPCLNNIAFFSHDDQLLNRVKFKTGYHLRPKTYNSLAPDSSSLTLFEVIFEDGQGNPLPSVTFSYHHEDYNFEGFGIYREAKVPNGSDVMEHRPWMDIEEKDYWGYYCKRVEGAVTNNFNHEGKYGQAHIIQEGTDFPYAAAWSLDKVSLPSGMSIQWVYEANRYDKANNLKAKADSTNKYGGGIRVKKVIVNDNHGNDYETRYYYTDKPGHFDENEEGVTSSGHATIEPYCYLSGGEERLHEKAFGALYSPAKVVYEMVQVVDNYNYATGETPHGYTVYRFVTPADPNCDNKGKYGHIDNGWKRGKIRSLNKYDSKGNLVDSTEWEYAYGQRLVSPHIVNNEYKYIDFNTAGTTYLKKVKNMVDSVYSEKEFKYAIDDYGNENIGEKISFEVIHPQYLFTTDWMPHNYLSYTVIDSITDAIVIILMQKGMAIPSGGFAPDSTRTIRISNIEMGDEPTYVWEMGEWIPIDGSYGDFCENFDTVTIDDSVYIYPSCEYQVTIGGYDYSVYIYERQTIVISRKDTIPTVHDYDGRPNYIITQNSNGARKISEVIPAFTQYSSMGEDQHHLLSPVYQQIVYYYEVDIANVVSASVSTWTLPSEDIPWRPYASYVWKEGLENDNFPSNDFTPFNENHPTWVYTGHIHRFDDYGRVVETVSPAGNGDPVHSVTIFGHEAKLPIASITNATFEECGVFTGGYWTKPHNDDFLDIHNGWILGLMHESPSTLHVCDQNKHFGQKSIHVQNSYGPTKNFSIKPGKGYLLSAWIFPQPGSNTIRFVVEIHENGSETAKDYVIGEFDDFQTEKWQFFEVYVPKEKLDDLDGVDDYFRVWIGNGPDDPPTHFFMDDIRFYPEDAMVTTTYYDCNLLRPIVTVDPNNNPSPKITYDSYGRVQNTKKMVHNGDDIFLDEKEYFFKQPFPGPNQPPNDVTYISPTDNIQFHGQTNGEIEVELKWNNSGDPDNGDLVLYDVYVKKVGEIDYTRYATTHDTVCTLALAVDGFFESNVTYKWQIIGRDLSEEKQGPVWSFSFVNSPPTKPAITLPRFEGHNPDTIKHMVPFACAWSCDPEDPDHDEVIYYIHTERTDLSVVDSIFGPYTERFTIPHLNEPRLDWGNYNLFIRAIDPFGESVDSDTLTFWVQHPQ